MVTLCLVLIGSGIFAELEITYPPGSSGSETAAAALLSAASGFTAAGAACLPCPGCACTERTKAASRPVKMLRCIYFYEITPCVYIFQL
ncbi:hypothetical protein N180_05000 [Pedobacter antarcticus 4BY]|uniref:Uncharacterized protein n=1 Tax=Pedobacter antarcticus 4BY TaxID=1358423 RepID=A0A081PIR0_9SPHI|nr:hypothetical protein N180_05000 [Pedobacter antarcticus 4BY]